MCLLVWIASDAEIAPFRRAERTVPDPSVGYAEVIPVAADAPIRARFALPNVVAFGSHEGCGCGFNSDDCTFAGFETTREVEPLLAALGDAERAEFLAEQGSRGRLRDAVARASAAGGRVDVYACWAGDEPLEPLARVEVSASHFAERLSPLAERVMYRVRPELA